MENHDADFIAAGSGRARRVRLHRGNGTATERRRNASTPAAECNLPAAPTPASTPTNDGRDAPVLLECVMPVLSSGAAFQPSASRGEELGSTKRKRPRSKQSRGLSGGSY
jgi:hypothetical protein